MNHNMNHNMNPLNFKEFIKNGSHNNNLYQKFKELLTPSSIKTNSKIIFLGKGKNGIVYKIDSDTTIKIFKNITLDCIRNNKYAKFCTFFYNEVMIGMLLNNLVIENICYNFPIIKSAMIFNEIGVIVRDYSEYIFQDFLKKTYDTKIINNLIFQYFLAIGIIHSKYQSNILDNKLTNLYVKKTNKKKLVYKINDKIYEINCYGYLIIIGDYGASKFNYPYENHMVQLVKYTKIDNFFSKKYENIKETTKSINKFDESTYELTRQIYFEGLFNPYIEHVFLVIHIENFCKINRRKFDIIDRYKKITKFDRNGVYLLRKNLTMIELIDDMIKFI